MNKVQLSMSLSKMIGVFIFLMAATINSFAKEAGDDSVASAVKNPEVASVSHSHSHSQATGPDSAYSLVASTTEDLLVLIQSAKEYVNEDEERFNRELEVLLRPFVDFHSFARAVMGKHASKKKMAALAEAEQDVLNEKIDRFSEVFSKALIKTYGKGLLAFDGERIEVVPPTIGDESGNSSTRVKVKQLIYGERQKPFEIYYSMRKNDDNEWRLRNLIIESINLGKVYRNQFYNAYDVYDGDINRVIEGWIVEETIEE